MTNLLHFWGPSTKLRLQNLQQDDIPDIFWASEPKAMGVVKKPATHHNPPLTKGKKASNGDLKPTKKDPLTKGNGDVKPVGKKWYKVKVTYAKKPERAYITAQADAKSKYRLLTEVTKKRTIHQQRVIQSIHQDVLKMGLIKLQRRERSDKLR